MAEAEKLFPEEFSDLEPYREWVLPTELARIERRTNRPDAELRAFYDALLPRMDEVVRYLNRFPLDDMPEDARRLFHLAKALMEVANTVENGRSPVAWRFDISRFKPMHEKPA